MEGRRSASVNAFGDARVSFSAADSPSAIAFRAAAHQAAAKLSMEAVKKPRRATIMLKPKPGM